MKVFELIKEDMEQCIECDKYRNCDGNGYCKTCAAEQKKNTGVNEAMQQYAVVYNGPNGPKPISGPYQSEAEAHEHAHIFGTPIGDLNDTSAEYYIVVYDPSMGQLEPSHLVGEAWAKPAKVKHTGKNTNKSVAKLKKEETKAKKRGDTKAMRQKNFAIRAKTGWGKVK